jgi:hypothetical protein
MKLWRSAGWPSRDPIDIELLAAGWVSLVGEHPAQECLRLTDAGIAVLAQSRQDNRRAASAHDRLALRMADLLTESGRLVWRELSLRSQVELAPPTLPALASHTGGQGGQGGQTEAHRHFMVSEGLWAEESEAVAGRPQAAPKPPVQWRLARPDLFSVRRTSNPAYLQPLVHEVKVSRADLFSDLRHKAKRASYQWLCCECHYVFPAGMAEPRELPEELGVWVIHGGIDTGQLELLRPARHAPCTIPFDVWMAMAKATPVQRPLERTQAELADVGDGELLTTATPTAAAPDDRAD